MREILFRGKRIDNGEWVYGNFVMDATEQVQREKIPLDPILVDGFIRRYDLAKQKIVMHEVDRATIGQYTGLTDKNGKKIFEGDIVKMSFEGTSREDGGDFSEHCYDVDFDGYKIGVATFGGYGTFLKAFHGELYEDGEKVEGWKPARRSRLAAYRSEVIGNIHDNPELMGGNENERN